MNCEPLNLEGNSKKKIKRFMFWLKIELKLVFSCASKELCSKFKNLEIIMINLISRGENSSKFKNTDPLRKGEKMVT